MKLTDPLKFGKEVEVLPVPIQNTASPYATEAAMHLDQSNQLEGYGYLVDGVGAFTYLGTVAGTAADYEAFGSNSNNIFVNFAPFITKWNITTAGKTVTLPLKANTRCDFEINWGDGSPIQRIKSFDDVQKTHTYSAIGVYEISIKGTLEFFGYPRGHAKTYQIIEIVQWGDIEWKEVVFYECMTLAAIPQLEAPNFLGVSTLSGLFETCPITEVSSQLLLHAKNVTLFNFFLNDTAITEVPVGFFDNCLSAVGFSGIFKGAPITTLPTGLFKGSINAKYFNGAFRGCPLNAIPEDMFSSCILAENFNDVFYQFSDNSSLIPLIPKNLFKYNKRANDFSGAFRYCTNLGTTAVPELWIDFPTAFSGTAFDAISTTVSNYNKIPIAWGGPFTGTYPQLPIELRAYWHYTLQKPIWRKEDGTYVDATGTIV